MLSEYGQVLELHRALFEVNRAASHLSWSINELYFLAVDKPKRPTAEMIRRAITSEGDSTTESVYSVEWTIRDVFTSTFTSIVSFQDFMNLSRELLRTYSFDFVDVSMTRRPHVDTWSMKLLRDLQSYSLYEAAFQHITSPKTISEAIDSLGYLFDMLANVDVSLEFTPLDKHIQDLDDWLFAWNQRIRVCPLLFDDYGEFDATDVNIEKFQRIIPQSRTAEEDSFHPTNIATDDRTNSATDDSYTDYFSPKEWRYAWGIRVDEQKMKSMPKRTWSDRKKSFTVRIIPCPVQNC